MSIFDFLKKKKKPEEKKVEKKEKAEARPLSKVKKEEAKPKPSRVKRRVSEGAWRILRSPHVTEKATSLGEKNKYVFKVLSKANKIEIKKAVEGIYGVDVIDVKIINIPKKKRRLGRQTGWRKGYKKAIIRVKEGQKIEILPR